MSGNTEMTDAQQAITVHNVALKPVEFKGQRVVTLAMIDRVHQRPEGTARVAFNAHKNKLIEGEDYFVCQTREAAKEFGIIAPNGLNLLTKSGYLMLVKPFGDDLAWQVQRGLMTHYFHPQTATTFPEALRLAANLAERAEIAGGTR